MNWETETLIEEAKSVHKMILSENLLEIYFTELKNAVLVHECADKNEGFKQLSLV